MNSGYQRRYIPNDSNRNIEIFQFRKLVDVTRFESLNSMPCLDECEGNWQEAFT